MDNNRFIKLDTFEITDNVPGYIMADKDIVKTIAILNEKGYKTKSSCSGHFYLHQKYLNTNCDIKYIDEIKSDKSLSIEDIRDNDFDYWEDWKNTSIYIMFQDDYTFPNLPEKFANELNNSIRCTIEYFDSNHKRKSNKKIINEIEKYNRILENWAKSLPVIERKDD